METDKIKKILQELLKASEYTFDDFIKLHPIYYDDNQLWWLWSEEKNCWNLSDDVSILNLFEDFFQIPTEKIAKQKTFLINILKQKARRNKPLDILPYCIQFKDKIYSLLEKKEFPATPKYFLTSPIPYALSDNSDTPIIDKLFVQWVGEEWKLTLYELLAYACLREQFLQTIIALTGIGSNGKGTFQNLIITFLGKENCVSSNIKSLITRSFETSALYKKLLCVVGEVDSEDLSNTNLIKQLTGEDLIRYEFKGKTPFSETSPTTFIIASNCLPLTPDKSDAFYRRILTIDFPNQFPIKRDLLSIIPEQEFQNLTKKVVDCLLALMERQEFTHAGTIEEKRRRYEERSNPLMMFISQEYDEGGTGFTKLREFAKEFNNFLKQKKLRIETISKIGKKLRDEGFEISTRKTYGSEGEIISSDKSIIGLTKSVGNIGENSGFGGEKEETTQTTNSDYIPHKNGGKENELKI